MKVIIIGVLVMVFIVVVVILLNRQRIHNDSITSPSKSGSERKIDAPNPAELDWIKENLAKAREVVGKRENENIELEELDEAFAKWLDTHDPEKEDPNPIINAFGIAFGQYLVDHLGVDWMVVTDEHGTEMAVHCRLGDSGDFLVYPPNFVSKRYVNKQTNFFALIYPEMKKDMEELKKMGEKMR